MRQSPMTYFLAVFAIILSSQLISTDAYAKRFGGGKSFGSRPAFSKSFNRSAPKRSLSPAQKQAASKNQSIRNQMGKRGGIMGMLGALALGGLLGSLLFGGAFENFNLFDIVMLGGLFFIGMKLLSRGQQRPAYADNNNYRDTYRDDYQDAPAPVTSTQRSFDTDVLFNKDKAQQSNLNDIADDANISDEPEISIDGFDSRDFCGGAEQAFRMLQQAWDNGDQAEIRRMTTDKVFAEIKQQMQSQSANTQTEILSLESRVLSAEQVASEQHVVVLFDAYIHEMPERTTTDIREVWHFVRNAHSKETMWYVDGIQQVD